MTPTWMRYQLFGSTVPTAHEPRPEWLGSSSVEFKQQSRTPGQWSLSHSAGVFVLHRLFGSVHLYIWIHVSGICGRLFGSVAAVQVLTLTPLAVGLNLYHFGLPTA